MGRQRDSARTERTGGSVEEIVFQFLSKDSDFDIYVVLPDDSIRPVLATQQLRLSIMPYQKRPVDLLVGKTETFEKRKMTQSFIENEVFKKGVRVA